MSVFQQRLAQHTQTARGQSHECQPEGLVCNRRIWLYPSAEPNDATTQWRVLDRTGAAVASGECDTYAEAVEVVLAKWKELGGTIDA